MPYAYDWQVNGVPWYFPTTAEVLKCKRGDCESRAVLLASILKAKGIPYQILMSFDHIWVNYPGKQANALENDSVVLLQRVNGHLVWHWPKNFHLGAEIRRTVGHVLDAHARSAQSAFLCRTPSPAAHQPGDSPALATGRL